MSSLQKTLKQTAAQGGYYITVGDCRRTFYYNAGTDAAPLLSTNLASLSSNISSVLAGAGTGVFRDHGKTLLSSGRVFRKVQLMVSTGSVAFGALNAVASGTDGVSGTAYASTNNPGYFTGYIELPGQGGYSSGGAFTPVARLG